MNSQNSSYLMSDEDKKPRRSLSSLTPLNRSEVDEETRVEIKNMMEDIDAICGNDPTTSREKHLMLLLRQKTREKNTFKKKHSLEKSENIQLKIAVTKWRNKFYCVKNAEVVRCEIESYEKFVPSAFSTDQGLVNKKKGAFAKSEEEARQRWIFLFRKCNHDDIVRIRKYFFLFWVENGTRLQISSLALAKSFRQKVQNILRQREWNNDGLEQDEEKFDLMFSDAYIISTKLEEVLVNGTDENNVTFNWLDDFFCRLAARIADLYRKISEKIHSAKFEPGEELPNIYNIFTDTKYESCIHVFMRFHTTIIPENDSEDDWFL